MRIATAQECPTGGIVVSDNTTSVPVCNGAAGPQGPAGATGATGSQGPIGPAGPAGPAGGVVLDENTAVAAVMNLEMQITGMPLFRPTGVSRIGMNIPVQSIHTETGTRLINGPPIFPAFKVMLPPNAPLDDLRSWWQQVENGQFTSKDVTVRLQAPESSKFFHNALIIEMEDSLLSGFSDGVLTPASITITPGGMRASDAGLSGSLYALVDLAPMTSPRLKIDSSAAQAGLYRLSGGDQTITYQIDPVGGDRLGGIHGLASITDLAFTVVARASAFKADLNLFDQFFNWITAVVIGQGVPQRTLTITTFNAQGIQGETVLYPDTVATRVTFVNPLLVDPLTHIAPYVLDFTVRAQPPTP